MWCNFGWNWEKERIWDGIANETLYKIKKVKPQKRDQPTNGKGLKGKRNKRIEKYKKQMKYYGGKHELNMKETTENDVDIQFEVEILG